MAKLEGETPVFSEDRVRALVEPHRHERGPLIEVLHAVQADFGYVDKRAVAVIADELNLSRAEVHGVVTYYRDFRSEPPASSVVRLCRAEACQSMGAEALVAQACEKLGVRVGERTPDGRVELDQAFCFGNCALAPSVTVDGRLYGRLDAGHLDALLEAL